MNEDKNIWQHRFRARGGRGLFWGLILVALGGFWLVSNLELVPEPAKVVVPGLVILSGLVTLFTKRDTK